VEGLESHDKSWKWIVDDSEKKRKGYLRLGIVLFIAWLFPKSNKINTVITNQKDLKYIACNM
jgi:hypothetical protein